MKIKAGFPLEVVDDWPPYSIEHIWLQRLNNLYTVLNSPFYLKGVANGDIISADITDDSYVSEWSLVTESDNSVAWIIEHFESTVEQELRLLGCITERDSQHQLISVCIPGSVSYVDFNAVLSRFENENKISVAVPVDRMR